MPRRGQIAVVAVGQLDGEGWPQRAFRLDFQADFYKRLARDGDDAQFVDAEGLKKDLHLGGILGQQYGFAGIDFFARKQHLFSGLLGLGEDFLGTFQVFFTRSAHAQLDLLLGHGEVNGVLVLDFLEGGERRLCDAISDEAIALAGGSFWVRRRKIEIIDVAAGAVGQNADERRVLLSRPKQLGHAPGEFAEIIGGQCRSSPNIMERVIRQKGQGPSLGSLHRDERHVRIGRPGRLDQVLVQVAGVHAHAIGQAAERIGPEPFHEPAAIEHLRLVLAHAPTDPRRRQVGVRFFYSLGNLLGQILLVGLIGIALEDAGDGGSAVGVRGGNEDALGRYAGALVSQRLGGVGDLARNHAAIDDGQGDAGPAVVEHQAARVQAIAGGFGLAVLRAAVDGNGKLPGRDILGMGAGPEDRFFLAGLAC